MNTFKQDWIKEVNEDIIWICQLPRSGGTLLLRLLDSHPEIHNYSIVFGFQTEGRIWPTEKELRESEDVLNGPLSYMNMEKFHLQGVKKKTSNMAQRYYPVYFDGDWFREVFNLYFDGSSFRNYFDAYFTAMFNAWRNYQNLYGAKKYITGQSTLLDPSLFSQNYINFKKAYPGGKMIFMLRNIEDWLASSLAIRSDITVFRQEDPGDVIRYYKTEMKELLKVIDKDSFIVFSFEDLVLNSREVLLKLCETLGISWNESLLNATFNSEPFFQNSSFELIPTSSIDKSVIGKGRLLDKNIRSAIDQEAIDLYNEVASYRTF